MLNLSDFLLFLSLCLFIFDRLFFIKLLICLTKIGTDSFDTAETLLVRTPQKLVEGRVMKFRLKDWLYALRVGVILVNCMGAEAKTFTAAVRLQLREIKFRNPNMFYTQR